MTSSKGEHNEEVFVPDFDIDSEEQVELFDDIIIMRFRTESQEPQMVEITNPVHKIIVEKVKFQKKNFYKLI